MLMAKNVVLKTIILALNFTQLAGLLILSESGQVLAESETTSHLDDTVRIDPLNNLKKYRGGYNVTNKHYWSSTAFTGVYGYALAVIWLLCGLGYGVFLLVRTTCCKSCRQLKKRSVCHKQCYNLWLFLSAIFFTLLAITACGLVLGGNSKFHSRSKMVINAIIGAADNASTTIYNTTGAMKEMSISLREVDERSKATDFLTWTSENLDSQAASIQTHASKNRCLIEKGLEMLYVITVATISLSLIVTVALLAFGVLKFRRTLQILVALCWIFTVLCWLFFGFYFFLQKFAADTCTALEGFQQDPYNNSLSSILPCDDLLSAKSVLTDVSAGIYDLVNKVNQNISISYGNILQICNPFSSPPMYEYQPWTCSATSTQIGDIPRVLRMLACPDSQSTCNGGILVPTSYYKMIEAYSFSIQKLLDAYPDMESLIRCQTVKDAFSQILQKHCRPLKRYLRVLWEALVFLSVVLMVLILIWTIGAHHEQNHSSLGGIVTPTSSNM